MVAQVFPNLISLNTAKDQCRVLHSDDDDRIDRFRIQGQKIVIDYLKVADTFFDYTPDTSPVVGAPLEFHIEAAMLIVIENLYNGIDPISETVASLLMRSRDPALA